MRSASRSRDVGSGWPLIGRRNKETRWAPIPRSRRQELAGSTEIIRESHPACSKTPCHPSRPLRPQGRCGQGGTRPSWRAQRVVGASSNVTGLVQVVPAPSCDYRIWPPEANSNWVVCGRCQKKNIRGDCTYIPPSSATANRSSDIPSCPELPAPEDAHSSEDASEFPSAVKSTINARLGLPSTKKRCPIPLTDAPMFGSLSIPQVHDEGRFNQADNVLPPRKEADHLVRLYWCYLDSLEPLLDQKQFHRSYQALFTGGDIGSDYPIFLATLNLMFSLSIQLQESAPSQQREDSSEAFFLRAWHILRPKSILWDAGSLELIQCLLLMSRYLQCTRNLHQTWMVLGSAVRIAQSLGLHTSNTPSKQRVWQCCVSMDRYGIGLGYQSRCCMSHLIRLGTFHGHSDGPQSHYSQIHHLLMLSRLPVM